jgi:hypothetical protein
MSSDQHLPTLVLLVKSTGDSLKPGLGSAVDSHPSRPNEECDLKKL